MVKLLCAVVGVGSVFPVDIELSETVDDLKTKIKEENPGLIYFDADLLKLYLAREGDTWLNSRDADIKAVKAKKLPDRIKNLMQEHLLLDETCRLNNDEYFGDNLEQVDRDIHVLVDCPDEPDQGIKYKRKCVILPHNYCNMILMQHYLMMSGQDGFDGTLMEDWLSWHLPWSSLQSLFTVEKEKRA
ncbi:Crinkler (CRN) family protein [Phytophthora infestans T30-4]|uniref:Crinkler (CRN) family protein n=1 Tax=Phytophthora infestans (strain T30-4) TaxID=403677 RepID=D0P249_PHYIT|nr:Crinkler (CRN) family protein [Phytophthora infestans T30-4]EEY55476.1 Crinkler (CRN) family protein [Phytophthora infestans T30-4]|eukprot:XP_002895621.1 Crinkler (CRN) family protein [Phytophthora infestans T30-4]